MRISVRTIAALTLLGLAVSPAAPRAQGPAAKDLFDSTKLQEIRLSINSRDLAALRKNYNDNTYYTADLTWGTMKVRNVGVRSRGHGSRNPYKLGLLVDFGRYTTGQTFLGMTQLVLDNNYQDSSLMREFLAMTMYRHMQQIAPRESFGRLYINNLYEGLYTFVEAVTPGFTQENLGESNGYLFEYHFLDPPDLQQAGINLTAFNGEDLVNYELYEPLFEPQNHKTDPKTTIWNPIRELWREANSENDVGWVDRVKERIDLAQFVAHTAIQGYIAENDGMLGYAGMNNFYVYRFAGKDQHRVIPWDEDHAFERGFVAASIFRTGALGAPVLFTRAMERPDFYTQFLDMAEACALSADQDNWLAGQITQAYNLIRSAVLEDKNRRLTFDDTFPDFDTAVAELQDFAARRSSFVLPEVARLRLPGLK